MKITVIDGQGGGLGKLLVERIRRALPDSEIAAVGANSLATGQMLKAGADYGATGENAVICNCRDAGAVVGAMGIVVPDAMHGEISPRMAAAAAGAQCPVILIPMNQCHLQTPVLSMSLSDYADWAVDRLREIG